MTRRRGWRLLSWRLLKAEMLSAVSWPAGVWPASSQCGCRRSVIFSAMVSRLFYDRDKSAGVSLWCGSCGGYHSYSQNSVRPWPSLWLQWQFWLLQRNVTCDIDIHIEKRNIGSLCLCITASCSKCSSQCLWYCPVKPLPVMMTNPQTSVPTISLMTWFRPFCNQYIHEEAAAQNKQRNSFWRLPDSMMTCLWLLKCAVASGNSALSDNAWRLAHSFT